MPRGLPCYSADVADVSEFVRFACLETLTPYSLIYYKQYDIAYFTTLRLHYDKPFPAQPGSAAGYQPAGYRNGSPPGQGGTRAVFEGLGGGVDGLHNMV